MKNIALLLCLFLGGCASLPPRSAQNLDADWKFTLRDAPLADPTTSWQPVTVPHTWNALDGQDGSTPGATRRTTERNSDYFRGVGWYARSLDIPAAWQGRRVFIRFEAAAAVANVYVNGQAIGEHRGSFTAFCFEVTRYLKFGQLNELRVRVDNSLTKTVAPLAGDFNIDGGIYRPVRIFATDSVCVTPLDYASAGVYLTTQSLSEKEAQVEARTLVSNGLANATAADVIVEIKDAAGRMVATKSTTITVPAGNSPLPVAQTVSIANPHPWAGRHDPYLYSATVRIVRNGQTVDEVEQPLGLRTVQIVEADGFLLNGNPYPIYGVDRHQDLKDHGWAISPADHERDLHLMLDMGVTAIRLAHYPQSEYFHDLADRAGMLLWNEVPFVNQVPNPGESAQNPSPDTLAFNANLEQQMREMILQRYNHPAVAFWGLFNELGAGTTDKTALPVVQKLNAIAHELDHTRITVAASNHLANATNFVPDRICYNVYPGWYSTFASGDIGKLIDQRYAEQHHRIGLSEYGAGANPAQHQEGVLTPPTANNGKQHPEEWQSFVHEQDWAQIKGNPKLWGTFMWVMFDFASDGRNEGSRPGINDKGLVTQDRQIKKDVYYFYQANWTTAPMVYITSRRATVRQQAQTEIKVYSNCPEVELFVNGQSLGKVKTDNLKIARWPGVTLQSGRNTVVAVAQANGQEIKDTCEWTLAAPVLSTTTPSADNYKAHLNWNQDCERQVAAMKGKPVDIIFIGDSITRNFVARPSPSWPLVGRAVWDEHYASRNVLNFGVGADRTENVLWRLENMDIKDFRPKVAVILIGTNNTKDTAEAIAAGVKTVVKKTQDIFPGVKIILVSILPNARATQKMAEANKIIQTFGDNQTVYYFDLASKMTPEGGSWKGVGYDHLHLAPEGYELWATEMEPLLSTLLTDKS